MNHILAIVIMALAAQGVFTSMGEGMILRGVSSVLGKVFPMLGEKVKSNPLQLKWWQNELSHSFYACPRCMVSVYGTLALAAMWYTGTPVNWWLWPVYTLCAVGLQELMER